MYRLSLSTKFPARHFIIASSPKLPKGPNNLKDPNDLNAPKDPVTLKPHNPITKKGPHQILMQPPFILFPKETISCEEGDTTVR